MPSSVFPELGWVFVGVISAGLAVKHLHKPDRDFTLSDLLLCILLLASGPIGFVLLCLAIGSEVVLIPAEKPAIKTETHKNGEFEKK